MVASLQIGTVSSYYARQYYHGGERQLASTWFARAGQFGLSNGSVIDPSEFQNLHAGLDKVGQRLLTTRGREVEGIDFCFSPPKSVSLAYALTSDDALRAELFEAHHLAVRAALEVLETEATYARRGQGGVKREKVALTAALFTHDTARPAEHLDGAVFEDPQLHTHAVIVNLARREDGSVGGIDTRLGGWKLCLGAIYHANLARALTLLGLCPENIGFNGTFEIGFDAKAIEYFSARRSDVVAQLGLMGFATSDGSVAAAQAALATRRGKIEPNHVGDRREKWRTKAAELGFDADRRIGELRLISGSGPTIRTALDLGQQLAQLPELLTENEAAFPRRELLRQVASSHVGSSGDPASLVARCDELVTHDIIREVRRSPIGELVYSTPEMIMIEREVQRLSGELSVRAWRGLDQIRLNASADVAGLSDEQCDAVNQLAAPTMLAFLEGDAGSGKTHALKPLVQELQLSGYRVIAAAQAWRTARMLTSELGIEARALDAWLARAHTGELFLDPQTVILVDEAGQLGAKSTFALLQELNRQAQSGSVGCKLILIGDRKQLQPISAGAGLAIVGSALEGATLTAVRRQRDPLLREAVVQLARGDVEAAYARLQDLGAIAHVNTPYGAVTEAVRRWAALKHTAPQSDHLLLARTNAAVLALNSEVRSRLRHDGSLVGEDIPIEACTSSGQRFELPIAVGDHVRFGVRVDRLGLINGDTGEILSVKSQMSGSVYISARVRGETISFSSADIVDRHGRVRLAHDYAATVSSSQGLTVESCTVLLDQNYDRHDFYVATSRSRGSSVFVVDDSAIDLLVRAERNISSHRKHISSEERDAALLKRLSRIRGKETTLDVENAQRYPAMKEPKLLGPRARELSASR